MRARGKWILAVVLGGIGLGAVLGLAADPEMKRTPDPSWRPPQPRALADSREAVDYALVPAPAPYRDSYAPSWADEALTDWEPDYPEWTYSDYGADPPPEPAPPRPEANAETAPPERLAPEPQIAGTLDALY